MRTREVILARMSAADAIAFEFVGSVPIVLYGCNLCLAQWASGTLLQPAHKTDEVKRLVIAWDDGCSLAYRGKAYDTRILIVVRGCRGLHPPELEV